MDSAAINNQAIENDLVKLQEYRQLNNKMRRQFFVARRKRYTPELLKLKAQKKQIDAQITRLEGYLNEALTKDKRLSEMMHKMDGVTDEMNSILYDIYKKAERHNLEFQVSIGEGARYCRLDAVKRLALLINGKEQKIHPSQLRLF